MTVLFLVSAAAGLLLLLSAILCFRKKWLTRNKRIIITILAVLFLSSAAFSGYAYQKQVTEDKKNLFLALCYLQDANADAAKIHLNAVNETNQSIRFATDASWVLLEAGRGNITMSHLKLRLLKESGHSQKDQADILAYLEQNDLSQKEHSDAAALTLIQMLKLNEKKTERYRTYYMIESASAGNGSVDHQILTAYEEQYGSGDMTLLRIEDSLAYGNKSTALELVSELVAQSPSADNRMLLAEIVAEMAYEGSYIPEYCFGEEAAASAEKEKASLTRTLDKKESQMETVQASLETASDSARIEKLTRQKEELYAEIESLKSRIDNLYVYRAMNSIADIHTLEAEVMRARLYYSLRNYDKAIEILVAAADSIPAALSDNTAVTTGLYTVKKVYEGTGNYSASSEEFKDTIANLLSSASQGLMAVNFSSLSTDFTSKITTDLKYEGKNIYVLGFDDSQFPDITLTIGAQEEVIQDIFQKNSIQVKDTRIPVDYTAVLDEVQMTSLCFVVDVSGSMGGAPIEDVKSALNEFVRDMDRGQELSLVTFSSSASVNVPITSDKTQVQTGIAALHADGGTEIGEGIRVGTEALQQAKGIRTMLLLTDGQSSLDMDLAYQAKEAGITIYTIGFGDVNDQLLEEIATATGGQYIRADSSNELSSVYSSLGALIGNTITIQYTITENHDAFPRYFFLRDENYDCSIHYPYHTTEDESPENVSVDSLTPRTVSSEALAAARQNGETYSLNLYGKNLDQVVSVTLGNQQWALGERDDTTIQGTVTAEMETGLYDLTLLLADGSELYLENSFAVYEEGRTAYYQNYRLGCLNFYATETIYLEDGTLIFNGTRLSEFVSETASSTLDAYTDALIAVTYDPSMSPLAAEAQRQAQEEERQQAIANGEEVPPLEYPEPLGYLDLGEEGAFELDGTIYLNSSDPAAGNRNDVVMASGRLMGTCTSDQSVITPVEK